MFPVHGRGVAGGRDQPAVGPLYLPSRHPRARAAEGFPPPLYRSYDPIVAVTVQDILRMRPGLALSLVAGAQLQRRARRHGTSLEEEVRGILRNAVRDAGVPKAGLGTRMAARFARSGVTAELPELRGEIVRPADFRE